MMLTSSHVSVMVSSGVVVLCTSALFFSGYVIQQRTLHDLRLAIKEPAPPPPAIFLPDRFKTMTTELEDGTIVVVKEENATDDEQKPVKAEVHASVAGAEDSQKPLGVEEEARSQETRQQRQDEQEPEQPEIPAQELPQQPKQSEKPQRRVGAAERRRLIKEEIRRLSHYDRPMLYQRRLY